MDSSVATHVPPRVHARSRSGAVAWQKHAVPLLLPANGTVGNSSGDGE